MAEQQQANNTTPRFDVQRIYTKDISLETHDTPALFLEAWQPETYLDINITKHSLAENNYEMTVKIRATMKKKEKIVLLVEVLQAGIFHIAGHTQTNVERILQVECPTILFPFARAVVMNLSTHATFPPLVLPPVNFEVIYAQKLAQVAQDQGETADTTTTADATTH